MGWTRNFKNIYINKFIVRESKSSDNGAPDTTAFDDSNTYLIKAFDGTLVDLKSGGRTFINTYLQAPVVSAGFDWTLSRDRSTGTNVYIVFGSSNADEDVNDYTISVINSIAQVGDITTSASLDDNGNLNISYKVCIQSSEDATINEIGLFNQQIILHTIVYGGSGMALLYRKKLDEPITLTAGVPVNVYLNVTIPNPVAEY